MSQGKWNQNSLPGDIPCKVGEGNRKTKRGGQQGGNEGEKEKGTVRGKESPGQPGKEMSLEIWGKFRRVSDFSKATFTTRR